jgi:RNA polymerase sigma-70 factor, ECF subfamily
MQNCSRSVLSDTKLLEAARQGDKDAFGDLVRRHHPRCVNLAASILRDPGEAEEEVQNAFWKAFRHLDQFQGEAEFFSWLLRIVKNQCLMLIRRRRGLQLVRLDDRGPEDSMSLQLSSGEVDPETEFGSREVQDLLHMEIGRIPPLLRTVIMLRDVKQLSIADVAHHLGITVPAAKSRLLRARFELRERMLRHCGRTGTWSLMTGAAASPERVSHQYSVRRG